MTLPKINIKKIHRNNSFLNTIYDFRGEVIANLHSYMGNSYLEIGEYEKALEHHQKDLQFAKSK